MPTFRAGNSSFRFEDASNGVLPYLKKQNFVWIQKSHSESKELKINSKDEHVLNLPYDFDINILIPYVDIMVSDYSSAVGEAMYFRKAIVFFVPDFEEYFGYSKTFGAYIAYNCYSNQ